MQLLIQHYHISCFRKAFRLEIHLSYWLYRINGMSIGFSSTFDVMKLWRVLQIEDIFYCAYLARQYEPKVTLYTNSNVLRILNAYFVKVIIWNICDMPKGITWRMLHVHLCMSSHGNLGKGNLITWTVLRKLKATWKITENHCRKNRENKQKSAHNKGSIYVWHIIDVPVTSKIYIIRQLFQPVVM